MKSFLRDIITDIIKGAIAAIIIMLAWNYFIVPLFQLPNLKADFGVVFVLYAFADLIITFLKRQHE